MVRWIALLTALLLAACGGEALPEAPGEGSASRANCEVAFDEIAAGETLTRLENNLRAFDATIERCPSFDVWAEMAQEKLPEVDLSNAEEFIAARCEANEALAETILCQG